MDYIDCHRGVLLGSAQDPGTLFVKTVKTTSIDTEAAKLAMQKHLGVVSSHMMASKLFLAVIPATTRIVVSRLSPRIT